MRNGEVFKIIRFVHKSNTPPKFFTVPRYLQYETTDFKTFSDQINLNRLQRLIKVSRKLSM
jgi:hypothetical protein